MAVLLNMASTASFAGSLVWTVILFGGVFALIPFTVLFSWSKRLASVHAGLAFRVGSVVHLVTSALVVVLLAQNARNSGGSMGAQQMSVVFLPILGVVFVVTAFAVTEIGLWVHSRALAVLKADRSR